MFKVEADKAKNLLVMTFLGHVGPDDLKKEEDHVKALLQELTPGFQLLSDLTPLESMDPACLAYVSRNMDLLSKRGVSRVVRVIPDPHKDIGLNILSVFHYPRRTRIVTCENIVEAMAVLEG
jgi:hypothetical protein